MAFTPTYITYDEFKALTIVTALETVLEADFLILDQRAELAIDSYVGRQEKFDEDQTRVFPRVCDIDSSGASEIPEQIQLAAARVIESMYKTGETKSASSNSMKSESIDGYNYSKDITAMSSKGINLIPPEAMLLLADFRRMSVQLSPPDVPISPLADGQINSRQRFVKNNL